jgi:hypothetical protein
MLNTPAEKLNSSAPFQVVLDELAYYATGDLDRMLAQGRSLDIMVWLAFQEVSGIVARIGEKTQTLLGNANLTVAMRQQDAKRTREWIQETAGQTSVAQATGYEGSDLGEYHDTRDVAVREVGRVNWSDLQRLIEGEAIILFGGRRIYARLFHAKIETSGPARLNRPQRRRDQQGAGFADAAGDDRRVYRGGGETGRGEGLCGRRDQGRGRGRLGRLGRAALGGRRAWICLHPDALYPNAGIGRGAERGAGAAIRRGEDRREAGSSGRREDSDRPGALRVDPDDRGHGRRVLRGGGSECARLFGGG